MPNTHRKKRKFPFTAVLLLIIILAAIIIILRSCSDKDEPVNPTPSPTAQVSPPPSAVPTDTPAPVPSPTLAPTAAPSPSASPSPSPSPSPTPSPSPSTTPALPLLSSGTFASDTGTPLNMNVNWSAYSDGNDVVLEVALTISTYSINVGAIYNGGTITVNGETYTFTTPALNYEGDTATVIGLGSKRFTVPGSGSGIVSVKAAWNFKGTYSGQEFESITAERDVQLG